MKTSEKYKVHLNGSVRYLELCREHQGVSTRASTAVHSVLP